MKICYQINDSIYDTAEDILNGYYYQLYGNDGKGGQRTPEVIGPNVRGHKPDASSVVLPGTALAARVSNLTAAIRYAQQQCGRKQSRR